MPPATTKVAAYVDGFNLYHGMHDARGRRGLWLDLPALVRSLLRGGQQLVALHYFTALVHGAGRTRQQSYIDAATAHGAGVFVPHVGRFQEKTVTCRRCHRTFKTYEEKESDVSLAVQLVEDAALQVFHQALLISGDSDMVPAISASRRLHPAARMVAVFPPRRSSHHLQQHVDATLRIYDKAPERHQLPATVTASDGRSWRRPLYWQ